MRSRGKTLILVRHAHRDHSDPDLDNGLSDEGREQAWILSKQLQSAMDLSCPTLITSPRLRCIETLEPIERITRQKIEKEPLLLEQQQNEETSKFKQRVKDFLRSWYKDSTGLTIVCSHGDWLSYALKLLVGAKAEFKKAGWAEIGLINKSPILKFRPNAQGQKS